MPALPRRVDDPLKIYTADVRDASTEAQALPIALMERSHLTAVIMAPMPESLFDEIVATLNAAAHGENWRCPHLLFLLSAPVAPLATHIAAVAWPASLNVMVSTEPMTSASGVWNSVLNTWNRVKHLHHGAGFPIRVGDLVIPEAEPDHSTPVADDRPALTPLPEVRELGPARLVVDSLRTTIDEARVLRVLEQLMRVEGMIGSCVVDVTTGLVLGQQLAEDVDDLSLDMAAATATEVLKAHRRAARDMGGDRVDEVIVTLGRRQQILRCVNSHADLFLLVVLDRQRTNLALARLRVMDTERLLA